MKALADRKTGEILAFISDDEQHLFKGHENIKILNLKRKTCPHCNGAGWIVEREK